MVCKYCCNQISSEDTLRYGGEIRLTCNFGIREISAFIKSCPQLCKDCGIALGEMFASLGLYIQRMENHLDNTVMAATTPSDHVEKILSRTNWEAYIRKYLTTVGKKEDRTENENISEHEPPLEEQRDNPFIERDNL